MDTTPLPNLDNDFSDSDSYHEELSPTIDYILRITPYEKFQDQDLVDFFKEEALICQYVIGKELVPTVHYHVVFSVDPSVSEQDVRDIIRAFLVPLWQTDDCKLPKGFGNKQYNLQVRKKPMTTAVAYTLKQKGGCWYDGFEEDFIDQCRAESFEKNTVKNFKSEYSLLCDTFQKSDDTILDFMINYGNLKAKYGQALRASDAYAYAISNLCKRDKRETHFLMEKYLAKQ